MDHLASSPFLTEEFNAPSPASIHFDISPDFDFPNDNPNHFPHTPSYNGSYQNSPYSVLSDLPPTFDNDYDNPSGITITEEYSEYDPAEYDLDNNSTHLLNFGDAFLDNQTVSVSVTPPTFDDSQHPYDHSSPASSTGMDDDRRSRASSTSSYHHPASPQLDLPTNFETLRFESPRWPSDQLPHDRPSPPAQKPQSPPQLLIPDATSPPPTALEPPLINAPDGDGLINAGPRLQIVPATPVSGRESNVQNVPFAQSNPMDHDTTRPSDTRPWDQSSQYPDQSSFSYPGSTPNDPSSAALTFAPPPPSQPRPESNQLSPQHHHHQLQKQRASYLHPPIQRSRSLSDTSLRPLWDTLPSSTTNNNYQGSTPDTDPAFPSQTRSHDPNRPSSLGTVNMSDVLPDPSASSSHSSLHSPPLASAPVHHSSFAPQSYHTQTSPRLHPNFVFGGHHHHQPTSPSPDFLSPDFPLGATSLRRVKSDSIRGHRQSRSEDLRISSTYQHPSSSSMLYPPPSTSQQEFISRQYLHPTETVASIASRGHHSHRRTASSGSRERPIGLGAGMGGWSSGASSARASPYPSPSASPRPGYGPLPPSPMPDLNIPSIGRHGLDSMGLNMSGIGVGVGVGVGVGGYVGGNPMGMGVTLGDGLPMTVSKVNVTTPSTADASQKRRKQPANFACPVPGCGSTFTRHFNLKGHLRSHAEEKPYQCKWPGCGKGFARQHDCKRHEQLHLNIRPYPCEGCKKNFARMDALNRHLRSEGGAECRKIQEELSSGDSATEGNGTSNSVGNRNNGNDNNINNNINNGSNGNGNGGMVSGGTTSGSENGKVEMKPDPDANWMNGGIVM